MLKTPTHFSGGSQSPDTTCTTMAKTELLYPKNVGAYVVMNFT